MPNEAANEMPKGLLGAVAATAGVAGATIMRSNRLNRIAKAKDLYESSAAGMEAANDARMPGMVARREEHAAQLLRDRAERTTPGDRSRAWSENQLDQNPDEFRKQIKARRLADKAAQASKMAKGMVKKMGSIAAVVGAADTAGIANRIDKEGGSFESRFGKFAEEWLGIPPGSTQRPLTETEKKAQWST